MQCARILTCNRAVGMVRSMWQRHFQQQQQQQHFLFKEREKQRRGGGGGVGVPCDLQGRMKNFFKGGSF